MKRSSCSIAVHTKKNELKAPTSKTSNIPNALTQLVQLVETNKIACYATSLTAGNMATTNESLNIAVHAANKKDNNYLRKPR